MISAIIITYHPIKQELELLISRLSEQVNGIIIVDNAPNTFPKELINNNIMYVPQSSNIGIAAALNKGIKKAEEMGAEFVVLFDQDSLPAADAIDNLYRTYQRLDHEGKKVAAVGAFYKNKHGKSYFSKLKGIKTEKMYSPNNDHVVETSFLITSGKFIPMAVFKVVGLTDEKLFIDLVDIEWCLRAHSKGFKCFGDFNAGLEHKIGEHSLKYWFGKNREIPEHNPFRYFFVFRNSVILQKRKYISLQWKVFNILFCSKLFIVLFLFSPSRFQITKMMFKGIIAGFGIKMKPPI